MGIFDFLSRKEADKGQRAAAASQTAPCNRDSNGWHERRKRKPGEHDAQLSGILEPDGSIRKEFGDLSVFLALAWKHGDGHIVAYSSDASPDRLLSVLDAAEPDLHLTRAVYVETGLFDVNAGGAAATLVCPRATMTPSILLMTAMSERMGGFFSGFLTEMFSAELGQEVPLVCRDPEVTLSQIYLGDDLLQGPAPLIEAIQQCVAIPWWDFPGFEGTYRREEGSVGPLPYSLHLAATANPAWRGNLVGYVRSFDTTGGRAALVLARVACEPSRDPVLFVGEGNTDPSVLRRRYARLRQLGPYQLGHIDEFPIVYLVVPRTASAAELERAYERFSADYASAVEP